jgi:hypothetical protein
MKLLPPRRTLLLLWQAVLGLLLLVPAPAAAVSCMPRPVDGCALVDNDSEIFVGRVLGKQVDELSWRMRVVRSFRGTAQGVVTVTVWANLSFAELEVGRDYLLYVSKTVENGVVSRSTPAACANWMQLSEVSKTELDFLSRLGSKTPDGRIVGNVVRPIDVLKREPLAGIPISLNTGASTVTDVNGRFEFGGLAPGSYLLGSTMPRELLAVASENPIEVISHACRGVYVEARPNTVVRGRVVLPGRLRAEELIVSAMTPDGFLVENAYADPQGAFTFLGLRPGEYVVGVNANGATPTVDRPFPPTFAPGTIDIQKADKIRIEVPSELTDVNIVVPRASPVSTVAVTAKDSSGRLVEGASVAVSLSGANFGVGQPTDSRGTARITLVTGVRQYLVVSGGSACSSPLVIGPEPPPTTLDVTLTQEGCREAHNLERTSSLRASARTTLGTLSVRVTLPDGTAAYKAHVSILSQTPRPFGASFQTDRDGRIALPAPLESRFRVSTSLVGNGMVCSAAEVWVNTEGGVRWQVRGSDDREPNWGAIAPSSGELGLRLDGPRCIAPSPAPSQP